MTKTAKSPLTMEVIEKSAQSFEKTKKVDVIVEIDGEKRAFEIEVYKKFSPVKIQGLLKEYVKNLDIARLKQYQKVKTREFQVNIAEPYFLYMLVKYFTNLGESMPTEFDKQIASLEHMINTTVLFQIVANFDESEIQKIKEALETLLENLESNIENIDELIEEYYDKLEDKSLLD